MTKTFGWNLFTFFILLLLVEKLEIILNKHKECHWFLCSLFLFNFINNFFFLISIFLCFALVPKLVPRTVDFHWYWYRILKFWYRDNTNHSHDFFHTNCFFLCHYHFILFLLKHTMLIFYS